eukprot:INCI13466.4.p1 GENE.INCI13466.4~~INCI13466.4.p1  ORF type:complete len:106 (-),score=10.93 INCI13466.4:309-626(-)
MRPPHLYIHTCFVPSPHACDVSFSAVVCCPEQLHTSGVIVMLRVRKGSVSVIVHKRVICFCLKKKLHAAGGRRANTERTWSEHGAKQQQHGVSRVPWRVALAGAS